MEIWKISLGRQHNNEFQSLFNMVFKMFYLYIFISFPNLLILGDCSKISLYPTLFTSFYPILSCPIQSYLILSIFYYPPTSLLPHSYFLFHCSILSLCLPSLLAPTNFPSHPPDFSNLLPILLLLISRHIPSLLLLYFIYFSPLALSYFPSPRSLNPSLLPSPQFSSLSWLTASSPYLYLVPPHLPTLTLPLLPILLLLPIINNPSSTCPPPDSSYVPLHYLPSHFLISLISSTSPSIVPFSHFTSSLTPNPYSSLLLPIPCSPTSPLLTSLSLLLLPATRPILLPLPHPLPSPFSTFHSLPPSPFLLFLPYFPSPTHPSPHFS